MGTSKFQFTQPRLVALSYSENPDFKSDKDTIEMPISLRPNIHRIKDKTKAVVDLQLTVGKENNETPFSISLTMSARFRWDQDCFSEESVDNLLKKNAVSLLLSYSRPLIATISSQTKFPTYDLPFIDLTGDDSEPKQT